MGLFARALGVVGSFFQIGGPTGPGLSNASGALVAQNSNQSAFANVRGADPIVANDFTTLEYDQAHWAALPLNAYEDVIPSGNNPQPVVAVGSRVLLQGDLKCSSDILCSGDMVWIDVPAVLPALPTAAAIASTADLLSTFQSVTPYILPRPTVPLGYRALLEGDYNSASDLLCSGDMVWMDEPAFPPGGLVALDGYTPANAADVVGLLSFGTPNTNIFAGTSPATTYNILGGEIGPIRVGTVFRLKFGGTCTTSAANTPFFLATIGNPGSGGNQFTVYSAATATSGTNIGFYGECNITYNGAGGSGSYTTATMLINSGTTGLAAQAVTVLVSNNTATLVPFPGSNYFNFSYQSPAATTTSINLYFATLERIKL